MDCVFCRIVQKIEPAYIVFEDRLTMAFLDRYPQNRGHLQLIPKKHYRFIYDVPEMAQIFGTAQKIIRVIIPVLEADHVTLGAFGHEIKHAHVWIVPQYRKLMSVEEAGRRSYLTDDQAVIAEKLTSALIHSATP